MKHRFLLLFVVLTGFSCGLQAQSFPFSDENLVYSIRHNLFPGNIGTMTFQGTDGADRYRVDATLKAAVGSLYTLDCNYKTTFLKDKELTPVTASRHHVEKKYSVKSRYDWTAPGQVHLDITKSTRPHRDETLRWPGTVRDLLGMIWWFRTRDYSKTVTCKGNALLLDHDALPLVVEACNRKTVKFNGRQTPVIEIVLSQDGKEAMRMTLTDDARQTPLKFSITMPFGTIKGTLASSRTP